MDNDDDEINKVEWKKKVVLQLIKHWKSHSALYDPSDELYTNRDFRQTALEEITYQLREHMPELTVQDIRTKINVLRSQYNREWTKIKKSQLKPLGRVYQPTAYWFQELHFLKDFLKVEKNKMDFKIDPLEESTFSFEPATESHEPPPKKSKPDSDEEEEQEHLEKLGDSPVLHRTVDNSKTLSEQDAALIVFIKANIADITDPDLKDDMYEEMVKTLFEFKRKQRNLQYQV